MKINLSNWVVTIATAGMLATSINANASNGIMAYGNGMISHGKSPIPKSQVRHNILAPVTTEDHYHWLY